MLRSDEIQTHRYLKITTFSIQCPFISTWRGMVDLSLEMVMHLVFATFMDPVHYFVDVPLKEFAL